MKVNECLATDNINNIPIKANITVTNKLLANCTFQMRQNEWEASTNGFVYSRQWDK